MPRLTFSLLAGVLLLSGCAAVPDLAPGPELRSGTDLLSTESLKGGNADWPADQWWTAYGDPQLNQIVDEALAGSPTLAETSARLKSAQARADMAAGGTLPSLSANGQVAQTKQSYNAGFPKLFVPKGYKEFGRASLDFGYDLDLWGRNRAALAAATSEARAAQADAAQSRLILTTTLVSAYADLARISGEIAAAEASARNRDASSELVQRQMANGVANRGEAQQAKAASAAARGELASLQEQASLARNRISALMGAGPDRGLKLSPPLAQAGTSAGLPDKVEINLVGRRPDLTAARLRAEAASRRIDVARAGFYPNINIAAFLGLQSLGLDALTQAGSDIGQAGLALSLPIFEGGRIRAGYKGARADYDAAVAAYNQALVLALKDVADAAVSERSLSVQLAAARESLSAGEAAYRIARLRYEGGLSSYLVLLTAENTVIAQRRAVAQLEARALSLDASMVRALGGGFRS
ncbi:MAG: multidrug transporter [Alphaproteobacteria bacterium PA2]|nr:MAG: multidrug transporter [Alphaproteobacteria bacterium PA2]